jgi:hypothetical protein
LSPDDEELLVFAEKVRLDLAVNDWLMLLGSGLGFGPRLRGDDSLENAMFCATAKLPRVAEG